MATNLKYKLADRNFCLKMATTTTERANEILDDGTLAEEVSKTIMCNSMKYSTVNVVCNLCGLYRNCNTILYYTAQYCLFH